MLSRGGFPGLRIRHMSIDDVTDSAIESLTQQLHPSDIERINAKSPSGQRASMAARMALASACNTSLIHIHLVNKKTRPESSKWSCQHEPWRATCRGGMAPQP